MPTINFAGIASGIDTNALIDAVSKSTRQARVVPSQTKVSELEETNSAFTTLKEKLQTLQQLGLKFATAGGGGLSKLATSSNEVSVTASASNAANNGTYTINVISKAKNHTHSFDQRFNSSSDVIYPGANDLSPAADRTVTYVIGEGANEKTIEIVITSSMTVSGFVNEFNQQVAALAPGYATASAVNVGTTGSPSFAIMVNTNSEGTSKGLISSVSLGDDLLADEIFADEFGEIQDSEDPATNAVFNVSGIVGDITRSSNSVSDVIAGLTFNIQGTGAATITVSDDVAKTQANIQEFVDAYNDIVKFINDNNRIVREENGENVDNVFSPLAKSRTDNNFITIMRNAMSLSRNQNVSQSTSLSVNTMSDFGIQTDRDGTLKFVVDDPTLPSFKKAMSDDPSLVNEILMRFGDLVSTTAGRPELLAGGGVIHQFTKFNGLIDITVNGNKSLITNLNDKIAQSEKFISQQEDNLRQRFARLESLMGQLQGQQQALNSALAGLNNTRR